MANDRLTGLDASFLHLEDDTAHMHVAAVMTFEGEPPEHDEVVEGIRTRLYLVPRYRQKLAFVPLGQGRPRWVDDPHFNLRYQVRHTALPEPGTGPRPRRAQRMSSSRGGPAFSRSDAIATSRCGRCGWSRASTAASASL